MAFPEVLNKIIYWQNWHYHIKYIPLIPVWIWYCIRSRSIWFFTPANPQLTLGGMEGETKEEMYNQLPEYSYPRSIFISSSEKLENIKTKMDEKGLCFPIAVKPNIGMMGLMFRIIKNNEELENYHKAISTKYVIQEVINYPLEVSVFYYRHPSQNHGTISGFLSKEVPMVTGDGKSTLIQLIKSNKSLSSNSAILINKNIKNLEKIIPLNEKFILSNASNRGQGGKLLSLQHEINESLVKVFDDISLYKGNFFYGRYDIKCKSIEDLKEGKNFSILEFNGCGSGTQQIYAHPYSLLEALKIILHHWKVLYNISKYNKQKGIKEYNFISGAKVIIDARKNYKSLKKLDLEIAV